MKMLEIIVEESQKNVFKLVYWEREYLCFEM